MLLFLLVAEVVYQWVHMVDNGVDKLSNSGGM